MPQGENKQGNMKPIKDLDLVDAMNKYDDAAIECCDTCMGWIYDLLKEKNNIIVLYNKDCDMYADDTPIKVRQGDNLVTLTTITLEGFNVIYSTIDGNKDYLNELSPGEIINLVDKLARIPKCWF